MTNRDGGPPESRADEALRISRSDGKGLPPANPASGPPPAADLVLVRFDAYELDEANARLLRAGEPLAVAPTPLAVLCALARQPGALVSKDALLDGVWGHRFVSESVLKTAVSELRTALADDARHPRYIETVSRRGYRFIGVTSAPATAQPSRATAAFAPALPAPSITGRVDALARLGAAWSRTCAGKSSIVWVAGDPGTGKTTLIDHFVASLGDCWPRSRSANATMGPPRTAARSRHSLINCRRRETPRLSRPPERYSRLGTRRSDRARRGADLRGPNAC